MTIGPIQLARPFSQAGLAGYSDRAMRLVARRRGCPYAVTEALLDVILLSGGHGLRKSIDINDEDHPVAGQLIGSDADSMARAARVLNEHGYDVIDLNFACPVKKIRNRARGGHMLGDVDRAISILRMVREALPPTAPTTVKLRRGLDDSPRSADDMLRILDAAFECGYAAATVHGRTVEQKYVGRSRRSFLSELKARYPDRTIIGSGDVFTAEDVVAMLRETGVDGVSIARGAIGNPWIFAHAAVLLGGCSTMDPHPNPLPGGEGEEPSPQLSSASGRGGLIRPPSIHEQREALREHFAISMQIHGDQIAGRRMRKQGIKYARFHPRAEQVKRDFVDVTGLRMWQEVLDRWYAADGPGVWPDPRAADEVNTEE